MDRLRAEPVFIGLGLFLDEEGGVGDEQADLAVLAADHPGPAEHVGAVPGRGGEPGPFGWGSVISRELGLAAPGQAAGVHLNMLITRVPDDAGN